MKNTFDTGIETRKEWVRPELKKIDIEKITAHHFGTGADNTGHHS